MPIDYIRLPREFYHNVIAYDTITTVGRFYAERHGNADVIRVLEWGSGIHARRPEREFMTDTESVFRGSGHSNRSSTSELSINYVDTCGKKLASVCPVC
jgi:hypothetical protein